MPGPVGLWKLKFCIALSTADHGVGLKKMTYFSEIQNRVNRIREFKEIYQKFLSLDSKPRLSDHEKTTKKEYREKINLLTGEIASYVAKAGVTASVGVPPVDTPLFENIYNLKRFHISSQSIIDRLDKAIGNYQYRQIEHKKKILNPFYWAGRIIRLPFSIISFAGFNGEKIETSIFGKLYKLITSILIIAAAVVQILTYFDLNFNSLKVFFNIV